MTKNMWRLIGWTCLAPLFVLLVYIFVHTVIEFIKCQTQTRGCRLENLELRRRVAEALGCNPKDVGFGGGRILPCCTCDDNRHGSGVESGFGRIIRAYELDHHHAIDALIGFCKKNGFDAELKIMSRQTGSSHCCSIWRLYYACVFGVVARKVNESLAVAICEAIAAAAGKKEAECLDHFT